MLKRIIFITAFILLVPFIAYADQRVWNSREACEAAAKAIEPNSILISYCSLCDNAHVEIWLAKSTDVEKIPLEDLYKVKIHGKRLYKSKRAFTNSYSEPVEYEAIKGPEDTLWFHKEIDLAYIYIPTGESSFGDLCEQLQLKCAINVDTIKITPLTVC